MGKIKGLFTTEVDIKIAKVVTQIISPVTASIAGFVVLYQAYIYPFHGVSLAWIGLAITLLVASIATLFYFIRSGRVSNWDISDRRQRPKVLALILFYDILLVVATWFLGIYEAVIILVLFSLSLGLASLITLYWKVSFHTFAVTLCTMFFLFTYNRIEFYPLLLLPFITAWTRIVLKKHSPSQAVGGIALALFTTASWALFPVLKRIVERFVGA